MVKHWTEYAIDALDRLVANEHVDAAMQELTDAVTAEIPAIRASAGHFKAALAELAPLGVRLLPLVVRLSRSAGV